MMKNILTSIKDSIVGIFNRITFDANVSVSLREKKEEPPTPYIIEYLDENDEEHTN